MSPSAFERLDFWGSTLFAAKAIRPRGVDGGPRHLRDFVPPALLHPPVSGGTNPLCVSTGRHGRPDTPPPVLRPASVLTVLDDLKGEPCP